MLQHNATIKNSNGHYNDPEQQTDQNYLLSLYQKARKRFTEDVNFEIQSKLEVYKLQNNDSENIQLWEYICHISRREFQDIYKLLRIDSRLQERGESFYNPFLGQIVEDLLNKSIATESEGAVCIFESNISNKSSLNKTEEKIAIKSKKSEKSEETPNEMVLMIRKSDGGYLYGTTDIAAVYQRLNFIKILFSFLSHLFIYFN